MKVAGRELGSLLRPSSALNDLQNQRALTVRRPADLVVHQSAQVFLPID